MSIGNIIYELRTAKGLSQGELADMLDVSRQSVSKWETDAAIPELDKLVKICDAFEVSLDELVGRKPKEIQESVIDMQKMPSINTQKILGLVLLAISLIGGLLVLLLTEEMQDTYIALPIIIAAFACGLVCLLVKQNADYWCGWVEIIPIVVLLPSMLGKTIAVLITQLIAIVVMSIIADKIFSEASFKTGTGKSIALVLAWIAYVLLHGLDGHIMNISYYLFIVENSLLWGTAALLATYTVCYIKSLKRSQRT